MMFTQKNCSLHVTISTMNIGACQMTSSRSAVGSDAIGRVSSIVTVVRCSIVRITCFLRSLAVSHRLDNIIDTRHSRKSRSCGQHYFFRNGNFTLVKYLVTLSINCQTSLKYFGYRYFITLTRNFNKT